MGQKVNPHGLRVGVIKNWDSRWIVKKSEIGDTIVEDDKLRKQIKKDHYAAGISKIIIERVGTDEKIKITIHCGKPGVIIGGRGQDIGKYEATLSTLVGKTVKISIEPVKTPDTDAQLVAENIAGQLERRTSFRRAMKMCMQRSMKLGAKGIKTTVSGRLNGAEIARSETYHEGTIPLQTIRADIDYGFATANTTYGAIGVKVWIYKGEILKGENKKMVPANKPVDGGKK